MRTNHQNFSNSRRNFAPTAVLTKSGLVPISAARQSSSRAAASVSTVRPIKTAAPKPFVNVAKSRPNAFQKLHSPSRRPFYQQTTLKNRNLNNKVNTVKANSVNTAKGKRVTSAVGEQGIDVVRSKACWVWRPKLKVLDHAPKTMDHTFVSNLTMLIQQAESREDIEVSMNILSVLVVYHTTNGHQFTMSNRHQALASPEQTVSGKDFSNSLIVDSLLKTIWFINAPCFCNKALAIPGQTATGKSKEVGTLRYLSLVIPLTKVGDEAVHKELGDRIERAVTTASSLEEEQDSGGYTPGSNEGSKKLNELTELCIKLSEKVKHLEDQLKSTTKRRKANVVISYEEADLVSEDPSKQGRMSRTKFEDVKTEHAEEVEYILEQIKRFTRSFSTAEEFLSTNEEIAQKLNDEQMTKAAASEGSRKYWKIIRVTYQSFEDMLKGFDREDLVALWSLVKERFGSAESSAVHGKSFMVHHVFSTRGHCIYMLPEKDYPLTTAVMMLMLSRRLQVEEDSEMARDLVKKIFIEANRSRS
ncbi:hypothetical protein Tco_0925100 [Tanacetum coccineum]|uniref:Kinesin motor domain-containing protein n=1 Tax=Tanacetum coccineum TaxID=301880 RepID=A0ABQ5D8V2_9ASTR